MTKGDEPAKTENEMQTDGEQRKDDHIRQQNLDERPGEQGNQRESENNQPDDDAATLTEGRDRLFRLPHLAVLAGNFFATEQSIRPNRENHGHDHKHQNKRALRQIVHAEHVEHGYQDRCDERSRKRAHTSDHHHDENRRQDVEIHQKVGAAFRQLDGAAKTGKHGAEEKNAREQPGLIDAQRPDHFPVLGRGSHEDADPGLGDEIPEPEQNERRDRNQRQVILRHRLAHNADDPLQSGCPRPKHVLGAPNEQGHVLNDQDDSECGNELKQFRCPVNRPQYADLDNDADDADGKAGEQDRSPEPNRTWQHLHNRIADKRAEHVEGAMREIDDPSDTENQRQSRRDQKQRRRIGKPGQKLCNEKTHWLCPETQMKGLEFRRAGDPPEPLSR